MAGRFNSPKQRAAVMRLMRLRQGLAKQTGFAGSMRKPHEMHSAAPDLIEEDGSLSPHGHDVAKELATLAHRWSMPQLTISNIVAGYMFDHPKGYRAAEFEVHPSLYSDSVGVSLRIYDDTEKGVSSPQRTIDLKNREAHHDAFFLTEEAKRHGIGARLNYAADQLYRKLGLKQVSLLADGSGNNSGRSVWAKQGFDFASPQIRRHASERFIEEVNAKYGPQSPELKVAKTLTTNRDLRSWEIAAFRDGNGRHFGTRFMDHMMDDYNGVRSMDPASMSDKVWQGYIWRKLREETGQIARKEFDPAVPSKPRFRNIEKLPELVARKRGEKPPKPDERQMALPGIGRQSPKPPSVAREIGDLGNNSSVSRQVAYTLHSRASWHDGFEHLVEMVGSRPAARRLMLDAARRSIHPSAADQTRRLIAKDEKRSRRLVS